MRTITNEHLPPNLHNITVIKFSERNRKHRMSLALERTLSRCSEIRAENELYVTQLRDKAEKDGFHSGFQLFFSELVAMLESYENSQNILMANYRQYLTDALKDALLDPQIIEKIIQHLSEKSIGHKVLTIILPQGVEFPVKNSSINYQFSDENHITIKNDFEAIRFPSESLCTQWLRHADEKIEPLTKSLSALSPLLLRDMADKLIALSYVSTCTTRD